MRSPQSETDIMFETSMPAINNFDYLIFIKIVMKCKFIVLIITKKKFYFCNDFLTVFTFKVCLR